MGRFDNTSGIAGATSGGARGTSDQDEPELVAEDLIEEVSIDGMCGVY